MHDVAADYIKSTYNTPDALETEKPVAYIAGPPPMVDAAIRILLTDARLPPQLIRYDKFS